MADVNVDVKTNYDDRGAKEATGDLDTYEDKLRQVDQAAEEVGRSTGGMFDGAKSSFTDLLSGISLVQQGFGAAQQAAQAAWDTISQGADLDRTTQQAEALAESIGTSWGTLLGQMTDATGGMISQADLAASAVDIIGLGMAGTGDEVTRLSRLVGELGWDMQTLTLTLANQSTARLDSLGLAMGDVTGRAKELQAAGASVEEAFQLAVIEAGEKKLELLGSAAGTAAGDIDTLEASWANMQATIAENAVDIASPFLSGIAEDARNAQAIRAALERGIITEEEWIAANRAGGQDLSIKAEAIAELIAEIELLTRTEDAYVSGLERDSNARKDAAQAAIDQAQAYDELRQASYGSRTESQDQAEIREQMAKQRDLAYEILDGYEAAGLAVQANADHMTIAADAAALWADSVAQIQAQSGDDFTSAAFDTEMIDTSSESLYRHVDALGADATALGELGVQLGLITQEQSDFGVNVAQQETVMRALDEAVRNNIIGVEQYKEAYDLAVQSLEKPLPTPDESTIRDDFFAATGTTAITVDPSPFLETVQSAADEARGIVEGFTDPDDVYEAVMDMDISAVEDGVQSAQDLLNSVEDKTITITVAAVIDDAIEDFIDE